MPNIRFRCGYRKSNKTTNDCYECSKHNNCELFRDMLAEEEDRARDGDESTSLSLLTIPMFFY